MPELDFAGTFGLDNLDIFTGNKIATIALVVFIALVIFIGIGFLVYMIYKKRIYIYTIVVYKNIGNNPTRAGVFKARNISIGKAGDNLWFVGGCKKYITVPSIQSGRNEFWFWIRDDGEWVNFGLKDLDEDFKKAGAKYIHQDMRMQRLATDRLLEQRLLQKSFWDQYGTTIMTVLFFLIIAVSLTIFMYMFGKNIDKLGVLINAVAEIELSKNGVDTGQLIPASMLLLIPRQITNIFRRKNV
jgi:hypothetical protein